jgi:hypothetical protein
MCMMKYVSFQTLSCEIVDAMHVIPHSLLSCNRRRHFGRSMQRNWILYDSHLRREILHKLALMQLIHLTTHTLMMMLMMMLMKILDFQSQSDQVIAWKHLTLEVKRPLQSTWHAMKAITRYYPEQSSRSCRNSKGRRKPFETRRCDLPTLLHTHTACPLKAYSHPTPLRIDDNFTDSRISEDIVTSWYCARKQHDKAANVSKTAS